MTSRRKLKPLPMSLRFCCAGGGPGQSWKISSAPKVVKLTSIHTVLYIRVDMLSVLGLDCSIFLPTVTLCRNESHYIGFLVRTGITPLIPSRQKISVYLSRASAAGATVTCQGWQSGCHQEIQRAAGQVCRKAAMGVTSWRSDQCST